MFKPLNFLLSLLVGPKRYQCETQIPRSGVWIPYEKPFRRLKAAESFIRFARPFGVQMRVYDEFDRRPL